MAKVRASKATQGPTNDQPAAQRIERACTSLALKKAVRRPGSTVLSEYMTAGTGNEVSGVTGITYVLENGVESFVVEGKGAQDCIPMGNVAKWSWA